MTYSPYAFGSEILASGAECAFNRNLVTQGVSPTNGNLRAVCFTAQRSQTITAIRTYVTATNQTGATLCRIGLYTLDASDNATLVASTTNDTALWSNASASVDKALSASYGVTRGQRYAVALLVVGSSQAPAVGGLVVQSSGEAARVPRLTFSVGSQTDLPSSISVGSMSNTTVVPWAALVP